MSEDLHIEENKNSLTVNVRLETEKDINVIINGKRYIAEDTLGILQLSRQVAIDNVQAEHNKTNLNNGVKRAVKLRPDGTMKRNIVKARANLKPVNDKKISAKKPSQRNAVKKNYAMKPVDDNKNPS